MLRIRLRPCAALVALAALAAAGCGSSIRSEATEDQLDDLRVVDGGADAGPTAHLRVVASNLTSGTDQSYDPGDGVRILQALAPDVALIQEFNYGHNDETDLRKFVDTAFGSGFSYTRNRESQVPNGVVSRYAILEAGNWEDPKTSTRQFAWARIDVPGERDLWAVSVHLLTSGSANRQAEAQTIVAQLRAKVPEGDYVVMGGDFNTGSRGEACLRTLGEIFRTTPPFPIDNRGNDRTNGPRNKPYDWVIAGVTLDARAAPVALGGLLFPSGLVFDSRVFRPIDTIPPVRPGDSAALNMQHMAIARDFELPL